MADIVHIDLDKIKAPEPKTKTILQTRVLFATLATREGNQDLAHPIAIMEQYLRAVAQRALELNDLELHKLMLLLGLYSMADAGAPEYDPILVGALLSQ